jgi:hypothetical protein
MRFINYLQEEYILSTKTFAGTLIEFFKNPDKKEVREVCDNDAKYCRFMIDVKKRDVYMWTYKYLHDDTSKFFSKNGINNEYPSDGIKYLWGEGKLRPSGKLSVQTVDVSFRCKRAALDKLKKEVQFTNTWFEDPSLQDQIEKQKTWTSEGID